MKNKLYIHRCVIVMALISHQVEESTYKYGIKLDLH